MIFNAIYRLNGKVQKGKGQGKREPKYKKKTCPIKCGREHSNGSAYFCKTYRDKLLDERKELQTKIPLCITCLSKVNKDHSCPVGICSNCSALHNILLCPKERAAKALTLNEDNDDVGGSDGYDEDEYERNENDHAYLMSQNKDPKPSTSSRGITNDGKTKQAKEAEVQEESETADTDIHEKENNLSKLRQILKELSSSYVEGKRNHENAKSDSLRLVITSPMV